MADWKPWGDHPLVVTLGAIAAIASIISFIQIEFPPSKASEGVGESETYSSVAQAEMSARVVVRDSKTRRPIVQAKITFLSKDFSPTGYTDSEGVYILPSIPSRANSQEVRLVINKEGYEVYDRHIRIGEILEEIFLTPMSQPFPEKSQKNESPDKFNDRMIYRGISEAFVAYNKMGMSGMSIAVDECYSDIDSKSDIGKIKKCLSMDLASIYFDTDMAELMGFPTQDYFTYEKALNRAEIAFSKIKMSKEVWEKFLSKVWLPIIKLHYEEISRKNALDRDHNGTMELR